MLPRRSDDDDAFYCSCRNKTWNPICNKGLFELFLIPTVPLRPLLPPCQLQPALTIVCRLFILHTITFLRFLAAARLHTNMFRDRSSQRGIHVRNQLWCPQNTLLLAIPGGVQVHLSSGCVRFITFVIFFTPCYCPLSYLLYICHIFHTLLLSTVTKTCCRGACTHDCDTQASDCDVSSQTWCARKNLCVPQNWQFRHATRMLDVIMLDYPVKVRPMAGMWVQSVPVTAIPWGRMKTEQHNLVIRSIRKDD
jgi:hypothetical protein